MQVLAGGCACGGLRYEVRTPAIDAGYCHCTLCQRTTGAPVLAWASIPIEGFAYVAGTPAVYRSSDWGERRFCATCGAQIDYRDREQPASVSINIATLDDPGALPPARHIFTAHRIPWFEIADHLPRHEGGA